MQSIFSTQEKHSISQSIQAKKEAKENKAVQFANVNFSDTLKSFQNLVKNATVSSNLTNLYQVKSPEKSNFTLNLNVSLLPKNATHFEYDEKQVSNLNALVENFTGTKGDVKEAESFLLNEMKNLIAEFEELGFESLEFRALHEEYNKQISAKDKLKNEIIKEANAYFNEKNSIKADLLFNSIESKLSSYHQASQDGILYEFFAPIMPYLNGNTQNNIIKALYTISEELKNPTAFDLAGGKKLAWSVDEERIKFKILSQDELEYFYAQRQKTKAFQSFAKSFENKDEFLILQKNSNLQSNFKPQSLLKGLLNSLDEMNSLQNVKV